MTLSIPLNCHWRLIPAGVLSLIENQPCWKKLVNTWCFALDKWNFALLIEPNTWYWLKRFLVWCNIYLRHLLQCGLTLRRLISSLSSCMCPRADSSCRFFQPLKYKTFSCYHLGSVYLLQAKDTLVALNALLSNAHSLEEYTQNNTDRCIFNI